MAAQPALANPSLSWTEPWQTGDPSGPWIVQLGGIVQSTPGGVVGDIVGGDLFWFATKADAEAARSYFGNQTIAVGVTNSMVEGVAASIPVVGPDVAGAEKSISGAGAIIGKAGRFLDDLTSGPFWIRAGEILAGLILLAIGVNALFKGKPMNVITGAAGTVGKVVP
jgi:hypothetical protein